MVWGVSDGVGVRVVHVFCRSGKSSISKVVFHKLSPNETLFLESTSKVVKDDISNSSFVQFQVCVCVCVRKGRKGRGLLSEGTAFVSS